MLHHRGGVIKVVYMLRDFSARVYPDNLLLKAENLDSVHSCSLSPYFPRDSCAVTKYTRVAERITRLPTGEGRSIKRRIEERNRRESTYIYSCVRAVLLLMLEPGRQRCNTAAAARPARVGVANVYRSH